MEIHQLNVSGLTDINIVDEYGYTERYLKRLEFTL